MDRVNKKIGGASRIAWGLNRRETLEQRYKPIAYSRPRPKHWRMHYDSQARPRKERLPVSVRRSHQASRRRVCGTPNQTPTRKAPCRHSRPHFSIMAAVTPVLFDALKEEDLLNGLLPCFTVVMPEGKRARRPFHQATGDIEIARAEIVVRWLTPLNARATSECQRIVVFMDGVLELTDSYAADVKKAYPVPHNAVEGCVIVSKLHGST